MRVLAVLRHHPQQAAVRFVPASPAARLIDGQIEGFDKGPARKYNHVDVYLNKSRCIIEETTDKTSYLLEFFKALADEKRLQLVGLLAQRDYSVEELAVILDLSSATVSHHLRRLADAGLVQAAADQHYHVYSLQREALHTMAEQILSQGTLQETTENLDLDAYDRKVLRDWIVDGRLKNIPRQWKKREVILRYLVKQFEPDRRYTEREVNEIIGRIHEDYATLRRELVESKRLARDHEVYWRIA
jgi:predicted transcriptional regulator